jgi:hypothetical protein
MSRKLKNDTMCWSYHKKLLPQPYLLMQAGYLDISKSFS